MSPWQRRRRKFSWRHDFGRVHWGATAGLNVLRALAAGVVWAVVVLIVSLGDPAGRWAPAWWAIPFIAGLAYTVFVILFVPAARLMAAWAGEPGTRGVDFATFVCGLPVAVGDPLVFLLHRKWPSRVPAPRFRVFNPAVVFFVLAPAEPRQKWRYS